MTIKEIKIDGVGFIFSDCIKCGCRFAIPSRMFKDQRERGGSHSCPNGHWQGWEKKQEREIDRLKSQAQSAISMAQQSSERCDKMERRLRAYKGTVTRLKKRNQPAKLRLVKKT